MFKKIFILTLCLVFIYSAIIQTTPIPESFIPLSSGQTPVSSSSMLNPLTSQISPPLIPSILPQVKPSTTSNSISSGILGGETQLTLPQIQKLMEDPFFKKVQNSVQQYLKQTYNTTLERILSLYAQVVSGTNYRFVCTTPIGLAQIKVFTQPWTNTIQVLSANITNSTGANTKPS